MIYNLRIPKEMTKRNEYGREKEKWLIYLMKKKENPFGFLSHHLPHANENACVCVCELEGSTSNYPLIIRK